MVVVLPEVGHGFLAVVPDMVLEQQRRQGRKAAVRLLDGDDLVEGGRDRDACLVVVRRHARGGRVGVAAAVAVSVEDAAAHDVPSRTEVLSHCALLSI